MRHPRFENEEMKLRIQRYTAVGALGLAAALALTAV
jgi:N,N'-diacetylchitobiose transport system substrate-binding protein